MRRFHRIHLWGVMSVLALMLVAGQNPPNLTPPASGFQSGPAAAATGSMEMPLQLIAEARRSYEGISDYTCLFVKQEMLHGQLQPQNLINMWVRTKPFSVYLNWKQPRDMVGQEACYVAGRNNGMIRVHSTGLLGAVGFVSLDPRDPRCLENSRHALTEAGIGHLIDRFSERWEMESRLNKTSARVAEYDYDKRRCLRVETIHPDNTGKQFSFYRSVVYFDKSNHLPIRVENYDWPRPGGNPNGTLLESYSYASLRLNVRIVDAIFNH